MVNTWLKVKRMIKRTFEYDVTIMQTPRKGEEKGYRQVYRLTLAAGNHDEAMLHIFRTFNVADTLPRDFKARFVSTGDVLMIDEGTGGKHYYKLWAGGWKPVNRAHIR
ncbi:YodL domain-containing protein [Priestia koreensis]|uniref:YodL domain-containing protein n=1 Tax=Priestia koreensis TaxID=284581 RepID=UPI001F58FF1E|nr:YodL domain-containing protein [Priestia koreensis]UNL86237.1 hypothetical protein IE339_07000 [Priestia koreensis]